MEVESDYLVFFITYQITTIFDLQNTVYYPTFNGLYWAFPMTRRYIEEIVDFITILNVVKVDVRCSPLYLPDDDHEYVFCRCQNNLIIQFFSSFSNQKLIFEIQYQF